MLKSFGTQAFKVYVSKNLLDSWFIFSHLWHSNKTQRSDFCEPWCIFRKLFFERKPNQERNDDFCFVSFSKVVVIAATISGCKKPFLVLASLTFDATTFDHNPFLQQHCCDWYICCFSTAADSAWLTDGFLSCSSSAISSFKFSLFLDWKIDQLPIFLFCFRDYFVQTILFCWSLKLVHRYNFLSLKENRLSHSS